MNHGLKVMFELKEESEGFITAKYANREEMETPSFFACCEYFAVSIFSEKKNYEPTPAS
jgi:hypothetical protein